MNVEDFVISKIRNVIQLMWPELNHTVIYYFTPKQIYNA